MLSEWDYIVLSIKIIFTYTLLSSSRCGIWARATGAGAFLFHLTVCRETIFST